MDEITQDVGGDTSPAAPPASTEVAISSDSTQESASQTEAAGSVTAQSGQEAKVSTQEGAELPPSEDDPLAGLPSMDELKAQAAQKVPYAQALVQIREAYEARKSELEGFKSLEGTKPLIEKYGDVETVSSRLEMFDQMFTPVINPETQQPVVDPESGFQFYDPTPFFQSVDEQNPGFAETALGAILKMEKPSVYTGQVEPLWKDMFRNSGLDPDRYDDYKNIDALTVAPSTDITPEELGEIDEKYHEAYKSFNADQRDDLRKASPLARESYLQDRAEKLERQRSEAAQAEADKAQEAQRQQTIRTYVETETNSYLAQQRQEGYATIMDDLASKVTFSGDEQANTVMHGLVGSLITSLIDPDLRFATEKTLNALGIKLDPSFDQSLAAATTASQDYKKYDLAGQKLMAQRALSEGRGPKEQIKTKLSAIALAAAKALGGTVQARANQTNQLLAEASRVRPTPGIGSAAAEGNGYLPAGMRADSPEADIYLARRAGLVG